MTLATRCNRCGTVFKLDQDALNAAEGWVRCGRCREVFHAIESLFDTSQSALPKRPSESADEGEDESGDAGKTADATARIDEPHAEAALHAETSAETSVETSAEVSTEPRATESDPEHHPDAPPTGSEAQPEAAPEAEPALDTAEDVIAPSAAQDAVQPVALASDTLEEDDARDLKAARISLFGPESASDEDRGFNTETGSDGMERMSLWPSTKAKRPSRRKRKPRAAKHRGDREFVMSETTIDVVTLPHPDVVDQLIASNERDTTFSEYEPTSGFEIPSRPSRRRRPQARLALRVAAILLGVGLVLQLVVHSRHAIAARWPSTEVALQRLCAPFGCDVQPPRDLQALRVQSVTFQETGTQGSYNLIVVLVNRATTRVMMPALDLRIADARGATAARRVLTASELGHSADAIAAEGEVTLQAVLKIDQANVSGYEVNVFYP